MTRKHFYHVGGSEDNRNPVLEALITNFDASIKEIPGMDITPKQDQRVRKYAHKQRLLTI